MDGLSVASSIISLIDLGKLLYTYVRDVIKAGEERKQLLEVLDNLNLVLELLEEREAKARRDPKIPWYQGLIALDKSATIANGQSISDGTGKGTGALRRLKEAMEKMTSELDISTGKERSVQRIMWPHKKVKFQAMLAEIERWQIQINTILDQDQFRLSEDNNARVQNIQDSISTFRNDTQIISINTDIIRNESKVIQNDTRTIRDDTKILQLDARDTNNRLRALEERGQRKDRAKERQAIISWLSPLEFRRRQTEILNAKCIWTAKRLLDSLEFNLWVSGRHWELSCQGQPGAGKTVLSSIVVDHLRKYFCDLNIPVLCLYLNYKERMVQTLDNLIGSLLKQLIQHQEDQFQSEKVRALFKEAKNESPPILDCVYQALQSEISIFQRVVIVVDALDEVSSTLRVELLNKLRDLENTSIMTTSRPFDNEFGTGARVKCRVCDKQPLKIYFNCSICDDGEFDLCQECKDKKEHCKDVSHTLTEPYEEVRIDIDPTDAEIKCYAEWALEREIELGASNRHDKRLKYLNVNTTNLGDRCREDPSLKERIPSVIVDRAGGMFMLAKLYMESLKVKLSVEEVNEALSTLPGGYSDTYEMAMDRIDSSSLANPNDKSSYLARRVLTLVAFACRPLSLIELQEALAVDLQKSKFNFNTEYSKKILFDITAGLVTVDSDEKAVRLVHRTAEDYFEQNQRRLFPNVSAHIAQTLLVYLSRKEFSEPCQGYEEYEEFDARKRKNSLLSYAYQHWGDHVKKAETDVETHSAAVQFMNDSKRIAAAIQAACYLEPTDAASWDVRKGANSLHICGWFGLTGIIPEMVRQGLEIDSRDPTYGQTALMYACRRGHLSTVATCLELGASVNYRSARKSTALFEAVAENHIGIVQLLLTKKELLINIPHSGKCEQTVLMLAAQEGYVEIVDMILNRFDLKINQTDAYKETALSLAAQTEKYKETAPAVLAAIKSLLTHPYLNIDAVNQTGNSALILAARKGREDVVDLLLSKGADVSIQDREGGGTALSWAVDEGNHSMVETMFKHDVNIQGVDERGRGLLHISAGKGNTDMINLLVQKGVAINLPDRKLRTPLHEASRFNRLDSIRLLLNLGANPSLEDQARRTPLVVAWENGHIQAMKLLETKSIADFQQDSPDSYPNEEKLPIWSLAKLGRKEMINRLIIENNSDLFCCDPDIGNSALHCAVASGQVEILQTLLKAGLAPNLRNEYSRAPLHIAAMKGDKLAATILISYDAALDALDKWSFTPLYYAQHGKKFETAITLIESGAATVQLSSPVIQTLFFAAIGLNCKVAVEILIQKGADLCAKNVIGQTARQMAKEKGHLDIQQVLKANRSQYRTRTMQREDGAERVISGFPQPKDILEEEDNERT